MTSDPGMTKYVVLPPECNDEDYAWASSICDPVGIEVEQACGCGFAAECVVHCNHEGMPDLCPGSPYRPRSSVDRITLS